MDELKLRFLNEVKLRAYQDKYIDPKEEREILEIAISLNVNLDSALAALRQVCDHHGYVLYSQVEDSARSRLLAAAANDGKVDEGEYNDVFAATKKAMHGKKTDREIHLMLINLLEEGGGTKIKTGWFSDWYARLKQEVGA